MRIGINVFELVLGEGSGPGAAVYIAELVRHLVRLSPDIECVLFVNHTVPRSGIFPPSQNCKYYPVSFDPRKRWTRMVWEQFGLPRVAHQLGLDLLHSPFSTAPLASLKIPKVVTVHDLAYFYYKQHYPTHIDLKARYYLLLQPLMFRRASHLATVSNFSKNELVTRLQIPLGLVTPIPHGTGTIALEAPSSLTQNDTTCDVLLTVASGLLHKNLLRLLEAYAGMPLKNERIILVGEIPEQPRARMITRAQLNEHARRLNLHGRLELKGYVSNAELQSLYRQARLCVVPSLYEGFGLPILEAMCFGVPVVSSNAASLPEVGADAVAYFEPTDVNDMSRVIGSVLQDAGLQRTLSMKGYERLNQFSWERTAAETLKLYRQVIG